MFKKDTRLPPFIGNTLRGALGQSLSATNPDLYDHVLKVSGDESVPNPFVISAPYPSKTEYKEGESLSFSITLFGTACTFDQEIIDAAKSMCNGKLANHK